MLRCALEYQLPQAAFAGRLIFLFSRFDAYTTPERAILSSRFCREKEASAASLLTLNDDAAACE